MNNAKRIQALRIVLRIGSVVFGMSALALTLVPRFFCELLAIPGSDELDWAMRMIGITLIALTGNMYVVSLYASEKGVSVAATVMQISAFLLGVITLTIPTGLNWFVLLYAFVGFVFSLSYTIFLANKKD